MLRMFENSSYVAPDLTTSWLRDFTGFIERNQVASSLSLVYLTLQSAYIYKSLSFYLSLTSVFLLLEAGKLAIVVYDS